MSVSNLSELQASQLFSALVELQVVLDDQDPVLRQSGMTRSPIHALAFLIVWMGLESGDDKEIVIKQLGELAAQYPLINHPENITVSALNALCRDIAWPNIINETLAQDSHKTALKLNIEVPQVEAFLKQIARVNPKLHQVLVDNQLVQKSDDHLKAVVTTTVQQKVSWFKTFETYNVDDSSGKTIWGWEVPETGYQFSESFQKKLQEITTSGRYGNFDINVGDSGEVNVWIRVEANNHKQAKEHVLRFDFEEQIVNSGIYDVFLSTKLAGMYGSIEGVIVKLACEAAMDRHGAEVKQKQVVEFLDGCSFEEIRRRPTEIIIDIVAFFNDSGIQVPFMDKNYSKDIQLDSDDVIHLRTKDPEQWVTCLPATYSASEHFYKGHTLTPAHSGVLEALQNKWEELKSENSCSIS